MSIEEIIQYARANIEPIDDGFEGPRYRCAAYLRDGLYLPCVVLTSGRRRIDQAERRIGETRPRNGFLIGRASNEAQLQYESVLRAFTTGNHVADWALERIEPSPFAFPLARLREIEGETSMGWTQFVAVMRDGKRFSFGTTYSLEFFALPQGYSGSDVAEIVSHAKESEEVFRERHYFTCFIEIM